MAAPPIQAYTFDAAMTLFEVHPSVGHVYAGTAAHFGAHADPAALERGFHQAFRERKPTDPHTSEAEEWEWWQGTVRRSFELAGALDALEHCFDDYFRAVYARFDEAAAWRIYDDVIPALERLRAVGHRLAIVSNFDSRLHTVVENLRLTPYFDAIVISAQAGVRKPDPAIFHHACGEIGVEPAAACHIGDHLEEDFHGAMAAGMRALLLERHSPRPRNGGITSLNQLTLDA